MPLPSSAVGAGGSGSGSGIGNAPGRDGIPDDSAMLETTTKPAAAPSGDDGEPACGADCKTPDAGGPAVADRPLDAGRPAPACAADEATGPSGLCYAVVAEPLGWNAARTNCQARAAGWDLASIRSADDSTFFGPLLVAEVWVGGSDGLLEGTWTWIDEGLEFWQGEGPAGAPLNGAFVNWFEDEPNGNDTSDCMRVLVDARWADLECVETRGSICQGPPR